MAEDEDTDPERLYKAERVFHDVVAKCSRSTAGLAEIDLNTSMKELGFESIDLVKLVVMIEDKFDLLLPQELLLSRVFTTPLSVWEILKERLPSD